LNIFGVDIEILATRVQREEDADLVVRSEARVQKLVSAVSLCYKDGRPGLPVSSVVRHCRPFSFCYVGRNTRSAIPVILIGLLLFLPAFLSSHRSSPVDKDHINGVVSP
jgi:hypothetical protein